MDDTHVNERFVQQKHVVYVRPLAKCINYTKVIQKVDFLKVLITNNVMEGFKRKFNASFPYTGKRRE